MLPRTRPGKKKGSGGWAGAPGVAWLQPPRRRGGAPGRRGRQGPWATRLPTRGARRCRCRCLLRLPPMAAGPGSLALALSAAARPGPPTGGRRRGSDPRSRPDPRPSSCLARPRSPRSWSPFSGPQLAPLSPAPARDDGHARAAAVAAGEGRGDGAHARGGGEPSWVGARAAGGLGSWRGKAGAGPRHEP